MSPCCSAACDSRSQPRDSASSWVCGVSSSSSLSAAAGRAAGPWACTNAMYFCSATVAGAGSRSCRCSAPRVSQACAMSGALRVSVSSCGAASAKRCAFSSERTYSRRTALLSGLAFRWSRTIVSAALSLAGNSSASAAGASLLGSSWKARWACASAFAVSPAASQARPTATRAGTCVAGASIEPRSACSINVAVAARSGARAYERGSEVMSAIRCGVGVRRSKACSGSSVSPIRFSAISSWIW